MIDAFAATVASQPRAPSRRPFPAPLAGVRRGRSRAP
eukprot:CAMPEP_0206018468 /NCGR_PEP_ID=MMETSP1464-20131121/27193_1 /ASSEMBLY_ACC=CAM_ASM_001124 /TAXON_ID=119497 /ORGANISM="Exanthemachrysis gayraliae, Strain RCC1523" /LENGTH=36 /DNA_ID= /DNA_START= /DNA_END= /DNA_ORIENTATION=